VHADWAVAVNCEFIDIGINLTHDSYDHDREAVLQRGLDAGVVQYIVTGASLEGTRAAIALAGAGAADSAGTPLACHPHRAGIDLDPAAFTALAALAEDPLVAAVGGHRPRLPPQFFRTPRTATRLRTAGGTGRAARQAAVSA
jgi:TatD DNase family protein